MGDGIADAIRLAFSRASGGMCGRSRTTLSMNRGTSEAEGDGIVVCTWLTFTVSRLIVMLVLPHGSHEVMVIGFAVVMLLLVVYGLIKSQKQG